MDVSERRAEKNFHLHFLVVWMGSRSTFVPCTALPLISAFCVIRDNRTKEVYTDGSLWNNESESKEVPGRNMSSWPFQTACMYYVVHSSIERHHLVPLPAGPNCIVHT